MPIANFETYNIISNRLIQEELACDCLAQEKENQELVCQLTEKQKVIYDEVLRDIEGKARGLFFVYGYGGTGGKTAHFRFVIPISVNEDSTCNISQGTPLAELTMQSKLIIWDEAPMMHKFCFEALDRIMMDFLRSKNPNSYDMTFGGKTIIFCGDFRKILPNLRLRSVQSPIEAKQIEEFENWIANIGNGTLGNSRDSEADFTIPDLFLLRSDDDLIATIVDNTIPSSGRGNEDLSYLKDSAILAPTLDVVDNINKYMNDRNPAEGRTYLNCDSVCKSDSNADMLADLHTPEFLNGLRCSGVPNHAFTLKVGSPVMLLRNIDHTLGLCNDTRLIVTRLADHMLEAQIMCGTRLLFKFQNVTYPVRSKIAFQIPTKAISFDAILCHDNKQKPMTNSFKSGIVFKKTRL
ncbi:PREDICTED: uncharacterized protein LOC109176378 [Ipomoea nil]|uniref:uncharacterized protein LOC109176378 n=1 Tax=Ipomoea nil TaxID=35883 RepID=UPI0009017B5A|nr:PREDICTED: uncharacterized protein LOC109176378 [Ipomoea nil]